MSDLEGSPSCGRMKQESLQTEVDAPGPQQVRPAGGGVNGWRSLGA